MQNCFEPVINEKQKQIDAFVEDALNSLEERIERISVGASDDYMAKLENEEYAKAICILTEVYAECPVMQCIKDALNKPDYIWDSTFIESIGKTVIPFTTHEGSGLANCVEDVKAAFAGANVTKGFSIYGHEVRTEKAKVEKWLKGLEY